MSIIFNRVNTQASKLTISKASRKNGVRSCWWWQQSHSSFLGFLLVVGLLLTSSLVAVVGTDGSESVENLLLLVSLADGGELDLGNLFDDGHGDTGDLGGSGSGLELLSGGVVDLTLLGLVLASGEDDELALVGVKSGDVHLELLFAGASSSVINGDSDSSGPCGGKLGTLKFSEGEATSVAHLAGVLAGGLGDDGTKSLSGSGEDTGSLSNSILVSLDLLSRLVEVSLGSH